MMSTRKQTARARKRALKFIESGKWFEEFSQAEKDKDMGLMTVLSVQWGLSEDLREWAKYRLSVVKGEKEEIEATKQLKRIVKASKY